MSTRIVLIYIGRCRVEGLVKVDKKKGKGKSITSCQERASRTQTHACLPAWLSSCLPARRSYNFYLPTRISSRMDNNRHRGFAERLEGFFPGKKTRKGTEGKSRVPRTNTALASSQAGVRSRSVAFLSMHPTRPAKKSLTLTEGPLHSQPRPARPSQFGPSSRSH